MHNGNVRDGLKKLWSEFGEDSCKDVSRFKGLLLDFCPQIEELELNLLVMSVQNALFRELKAFPAETIDSGSCKRILSHFIKATGVKDDYAYWALSVWAEILEKNIPDQKKVTISTEAAFSQQQPTLPNGSSSPQMPIPPAFQDYSKPNQTAPSPQGINFKSIIVAVGLILLGGMIFGIWGGAFSPKPIPTSNMPKVTSQTSNSSNMAPQPNNSSASHTSLPVSQNAAPAQSIIRPTPTAQISAGEAARRTVLRFYELIDSRNYTMAYDMFSKEWRSKMAFDPWRKGYSSTLGNQVNRANVVGSISAGDPTCIVRFQLTARDRLENGRVLIQVFQGEWRLLLEDGTWKLDDADVKIVDKRYE